MSKPTFGGGSPVVKINRGVYAMASADGVSADITMYGDIVEDAPRNWDGTPKKGNYVALDTFLEDLTKIAGCSNITIHMHSYGGDAGASTTIHNKLREMAGNGTELTCIVEGVAMSGGSVIMSACGTVRAYPSSQIMIHNCLMGLCGWYNLRDLDEIAGRQKAANKAMVEIYRRKTGLEESEIKRLMDETTYMTGREAKEKGFVDEILDTEEGAPAIAASADRHSLYVNGRQMMLPMGITAPDMIPIVQSGAVVPVQTKNNEPASTGNEGGNNNMASTVEELRAEYPDLVKQIEQSAVTTATAQASNDERDRIKGIDEVASLFSADMVTEAKYGATACDAKELTYRAAQAAAKSGAVFMATAQAQTEPNAKVGGTPPPAPAAAPTTPEEKQAQANADLSFLKDR